MISLVVAFNNNFVIGNDNEMLWKNSEDLKEFKKLTSNHIVIMGSKTFESLNMPKGLPNRINIVVSTKLSPKIYLEDSDVYFVGSIEESIEVAEMFSKYFSKEIFVIGGEQIYKAFVDKVDKMFISIIDDDSKGNKKFPLDQYLKLKWKITNVESFKTFLRITYER